LYKNKGNERIEQSNRSKKGRRKERKKKEREKHEEYTRNKTNIEGRNTAEE
jgi:hypothetical protein